MSTDALTDRAEALFVQAIALVEGPSTRAWAQSDRNRLIWIQIAATYLHKPDAVHRLAGRIAGEAIGLFG